MQNKKQCITEEEFRTLALRWKEDPTVFFDTVLRCTYWWKQEEIAKAVYEYGKVTVRSCHGPGKTYITARLALAFLYSHPDSIVITIAPTFRQVKELTWREIRGAKANSFISLGGDINLTNLNLSDNWYALGFATNNPGNIQGFHAQSGDILLIIEEAGSVDEATFEALSSIITSKGAKVLLIGNPTSSSGEFFTSFSSPKYYKIHIPAYCTPNFTDHGITDRKKLIKAGEAGLLDALDIKYPYLVTPAWAYDRYVKLGGDHPMFVARVEGEFPKESENTVIPYWAIEKCLMREESDEDRKNFEGINTIGIDVARFGSDDTVLVAMEKTVMKELESFNGKDTMKTVAAAIAMFKRLGFRQKTDAFVIDDTGLGGGVTDRLKELEYNVIPINFGESPNLADQFVNIKAEIYDDLEKQMKGGEITILDRGNLIRDLSVIKYDFTSDGKKGIIPKKILKKQGIPSPDTADALALANYGRYAGMFGVGEDPDPRTAYESRPYTANLMDVNL